MENKKRALGLGLEQLFNNENLDVDSIERHIYDNVSNEEIMMLPLTDLRPNPYQPRVVFDDDLLNELALSIKEYGVIQPIIVKKSIKGYEIIAGERRVRASRLAGLTNVPAIIRPFTDGQMMEIALLENLQRADLSAIEEANAYKCLLDKLDITQEELSKKVGKSRSHITNLLGLLRLPIEVQDLINNNKISMGHARALSKLDDNEQIKEMAKKIVDNKLGVRDIENKTASDEFVKKIKIARRVNNEYKYVEDLLRDKFDTKVSINDKKIAISFTSVADLNRILEIIDIKE
ncbi:MAG: ParB/RepB/Spo0J family partition protein [Bacilli bacterium]